MSELHPHLVPATAAKEHAYMFLGAVHLLKELINAVPPTGDQAARAPQESRRPAAALLYCQALRNVTRACMMAIKHLDGDQRTTLQQRLDQFNAAVPGMKDARDMLEHFDEYIVGTGNMQGEDGNPKYSVWLDHTPDGWSVRIGPSVIDVASAYDAAADLCGQVAVCTNDAR